MAKKSTSSEGSDFDANKLLKDLSSGGLQASFLSDEAISNVSEYINTGNYALNAIISGSVHGGIPSGRVTGFAGPSGVGKTMMMLKCIRTAQKMGYLPVYFDSENALDTESARRLGCDVNKIMHVTAVTIEDTQSQIANVLQKVIDANKKIDEFNKTADEADRKPRQKVMIIIDSLGNLISKKELANSLDNAVAGDMGQRAKVMGTLLRVVTNLSAVARAPVVFSNHTYESMEMYPSLVKKQSGGSKVLYLASVLLQMSMTLEKTKDNEGDDRSSLANRTVGRNLHFMTTKNRFIVGELECDVKLNYRTGIDPYSGLLDLAVQSGYIKQTGPTYYLGEEKLGYAKTFDNKEFWDKHLDELDEILKRETALSCVDELEEIDG